ncbi:MAG: FMN-binding protein [Planctomycetota bacterium]
MHTAAFLAILCGASALLVTLPRLHWKDEIAANRDFERNRAALEAFGLARDGSRPAVREAFEAHVTFRRADELEVFEAREGARLLGYALEIGGRSYDGPFKGFLAIDPWRNRIVGVTTYEQLRTKGGKGPAMSAEWLARFRGLPLVTNGKPGVAISWKAEDPDAPDAVSGATLRVSFMVKIVNAAIERFFASPLRVEPLDLGIGPDAVTRATPIYPPGLPRPPHLRREERRPVFMVPPGTRNLARGRPVASSTVDEPIIGELSQVTDGVKRSDDTDYVELDPRLQWVQIDLGLRARVHAIAVWHYYKGPVIYDDVIVQVADLPTFERGVVTLFNNDHDGSAGLGRGTGTAYLARWWGEIVDARGEDREGTTARYVRVYTGGGSGGEAARFVEVAAYGVAEPSAPRASP